MDKLCNLFRNLGNSLVLDEVLTTLDVELRRVMDYDAFAVHVGGPATYAANPGESLHEGWLVPSYVSGPGLDSSKLLENLAVQNLVPRALSAAQPVLEQFPWAPSSGAWVAAFPIQHLSEVIAVLAFFRIDSRSFSGEDLAVLREVAPKLAAAIENTRTYRIAGETDSFRHVPDLNNVRSLFRCLDAELARAGRSQTPVAVLQCSISAEDSPIVSQKQILDSCADLFRENCREYDFTARTGDDLVLVLPGFRRADFPDKLASIQELINCTFAFSPPPRLSVGAAFFPEDGADAEDLLAVAALRLYRNKHQPAAIPSREPDLGSVNVYSTQ